MIYRERIEKGGQARLYMIIVIVTRYNLSISMVGGGSGGGGGKKKSWARPFFLAGEWGRFLAYFHY